MLTKALKSAGVEFDAVTLQGMIGVATASDEVAAAKLLAEFGKTHESMKILGGVVDGKVVDAARCQSACFAPDPRTALGSTRRRRPWTGFRVSSTCSPAILRGLVNVLNAVKDAKPA